MTGRRLSTVAAAAGLSALLCAGAAAPAYAKSPSPTWESRALKLKDAHKKAQGEGVKVALIDSGVADHPALDGKVTTGPNLLQDGVHKGDAKFGVHGTAMASNILQAAPKAHILSIRVIDDDPSNDSDLRNATDNPMARAIQYAVDQDVDVISLSIGGDTMGDTFDEKDTAALAVASGANVPVVAASGNEADELNDTSYPAAYPSALAVAAFKKGGAHADFSNVHTYNAISAPGVGITSASNTGGWEKIQGTSPATALTSGVVACMLSAAPEHRLSPGQVRTILTRTAHHPPGGFNPVFGYGRIDAAAAVRAAAQPPREETKSRAHKGAAHLAKPDGIEPTQHPAWDVATLTVGLLASAAGGGMVAGAVLIARRARRTDGPATGASPGQPF
ncbi:S8 family peptidase [Streptomyces nanshensis]|uniref:Serine protease n=1 Tax=Streptomyces nanshensis TaxID=518642 RepID=A0A1E7L4B0_9ACTN|nr:S8 family serine peptidase [Streptomyces nanshensis]OEV11046.1 serine protease [Streptomyces nanshensis]